MSENMRKLIGLAVMALIVVLGLLIPGEEQVNSFQRNSAVSSVAGKIANIIGISKDAVLYAAKGTGVAAIALRLHKELEKL